MNKTLKNILKFLGIYAASSVLTIIIFYTFGWYVWNQPPTELVFLRMFFLTVILSVIATIIAFVITFIIKRAKKQ